MDRRVSLTTLGVGDLERARAFYEALGWTTEAAGATVPRRPAETSWGGCSGMFLDPDGHAWEVAHNPGFALAEDGSLTVPDFGSP